MEPNDSPLVRTHRTMGHPKMEGTHKNPQIQPLAPHRNAPYLNPTSESSVPTLLELWQLRALPTAPHIWNLEAAPSSCSSILALH